MSKNILIERKWAMPSAKTFSILPIRELITTVLNKLPGGAIVLDPFANQADIATDIATQRLQYISNDLDPDAPTHHHLDATEFLTMFNDVGLVLYDPPYSPRQVSEHYKRLGHTVDMKTTQASYWTKQKKAIANAVKSGGYVITFGWNSGGIGKTNGFEIEQILLVPHGGWHNDTICTVERKL